MIIKNSKTENMGLCRKSPNHVGIIFSENQQASEVQDKSHPRVDGGFPKNIIEVAGQSGVRFLTFFCQKSHGEEGHTDLGSDLKVLFHLLFIDQSWLLREGVAVRFFDESSGLKFSENCKLNISVISQFDGRSAIIDAVKQVVKKVEQEKITSSDITSNMIGEQIKPIELPDPDLLIFTGGVKQLRNGLLWQSAYSEFAFVDQPWENMTADCFKGILDDYMTRDRRFGGLTKKIHSKMSAG